MANRFKYKIYNLLSWLKRECGDKQTLALFAAVVIFMYSPAWCGGLLYWIFKWKWCATVATAYALFGAGPCTPFIPCCIAITLSLKKMLENRGILIYRESGKQIS